jgi:hypothetical protein
MCPYRYCKSTKTFMGMTCNKFRPVEKEERRGKDGDEF